jgi:hypothetical protein
MLIEFKVSNYRSIREEQTFSLVAAKSDKELPDCVIERDLPGLSGVQFLKGAAIYGANASGKSNIIEAIHFLSGFVRDSATKLQPNDSTGTKPFKLDQNSISKPSTFEITFVAEGVRYLFGLSLTEQRVIEEYLISYPKGAPQRWYHREFNQKKNIYEWAKPSTAFKDDKYLRDKTRDNSLFLSVGPQFNHPQLTQVFNWFKNNLHFINLSDSRLNPGFTADLIQKSGYHGRILNLLRSADFGITDTKIQKRQKKITLKELRKHVPPFLFAEFEKKHQAKPGETVDLIELNLIHKTEGVKQVLLDFDEEESAGTQRFFTLIGPWIDILDNGYTVFIDEIETSLHPILVREILGLLFCSKNNPKGAQVVFTTQNPILLDNTLMRRDQIWFTEKTPNGVTHLYPLTDYRPRKDEALAKGYLAGRYGAIPFIPDGLNL